MPRVSRLPLLQTGMRLEHDFVPPPYWFRQAAGRPLALRLKAQRRQSRLECELSFEVSCLFFRFWFAPSDPGVSGGGSCLAFRDFLAIDNLFPAAYHRRLLYVYMAHVKPPMFSKRIIVFSPA